MIKHVTSVTLGPPKIDVLSNTYQVKLIRNDNDTPSNKEGDLSS